ncbi:ABC transporter substrate-binding protein [Primorskyibacter sedentarius]|uniref:ABC transporter substrate-binding protein n=1 Tax=Primorskyibacter sedentarius TaxID=745311 RepID=UPI003EBB1BD5
MTRNTLRIALMLVFMALFLALIYVEKTRAKHVLIIHSYNTDYSWVEAINEGIERVLEDQRGVFTRYHYLDLKNHGGEDFRRTATQLAIRVVEETQPDVLVLFDDAAQVLVGQRFYEGDGEGTPGIKVVYGGVNGDPASYYGDSNNVSGILERKPMAVIRDIALTILHEQVAQGEAPITDPKIVFIGDTSDSITADLPHYSSIDWAPFEWLEPVQVGTFDDWKEAVQRGGEEADVILVTNYQQIRETPGGPFIRPASQAMKWADANATVPIVGMGWTNSEDGAMLSVSVSPYEQGEVAIREALALLEGAEPMGAITSKQFLVHICHPALARRGVTVPFIHEAFARATGNYYTEGC